MWGNLGEGGNHDIQAVRGIAELEWGDETILRCISPPRPMMICDDRNWGRELVFSSVNF